MRFGDVQDTSRISINRTKDETGRKRFERFRDFLEKSSAENRSMRRATISGVAFTM